MVSAGGEIREAFFAALNGNIVYGSQVPVYENEIDGQVNDEYSIHIKSLFGNNDDTNNSFDGLYRLNIEIVNRRINSSSTIDVYAIGRMIKNTITPSKQYVLPMGSDYQMIGLTSESSTELIEQDDSGVIVRLIMTFRFKVHEKILV